MELVTGNSSLEGGCVEDKNQRQEEHERVTATNHKAGEDIRNSTFVELANNPLVEIFYVCPDVYLKQTEAHESAAQKLLYRYCNI